MPWARVPQKESGGSFHIFTDGHIVSALNHGLTLLGLAPVGKKWSESAPLKSASFYIRPLAKLHYDFPLVPTFLFHELELPSHRKPDSSWNRFRSWNNYFVEYWREQLKYRAFQNPKGSIWRLEKYECHLRRRNGPHCLLAGQKQNQTICCQTI